MKKILFISILLLMFSACNDKKEKKSVVGSWNCEEHSDKNPSRTYQVNIVRDPVRKNFYKIYNFHKLGQNEDDAVLCEENPTNGELIIKDFNVKGMFFITEGKGIVAKDFSNIMWTYSFTNSSGLKNDVKAKYY